jgi:hypothetical protein
MANWAMRNGAIGPSAEVTAAEAAWVKVVRPSAYQR